MMFLKKCHGRWSMSLTVLKHKKCVTMPLMSTQDHFKTQKMCDDAVRKGFFFKGCSRLVCDTTTTKTLTV